MRVPLIILVLLFGFRFDAFSQFRVQRALYSQYHFNALALNPAFSATENQGRVTAISRHQWVGFEGAPQTQGISALLPVNDRSSVGFQLLNDKVGVEKEQSLFASYSQKVEIEQDKFLAAGIVAGLGSYLGEYGRLTDDDPLFVDQNEWRSNIGIGIMYFDEKIEAGFSIPYLAKFNLSGQAVEGVNTFRSDMYVSGSYRFNINQSIKAKPSMLIKYTPGVPVQIDGNFNVYFEPKGLWLGVGYRSEAAVMAMFQVRLNDRMQLGYAHDFTTSVKLKRQMGTHEIMLNYRFSLKKNTFNTMDFRF